jgi:hypothetical protein
MVLYDFKSIVSVVRVCFRRPKLVLALVQGIECLVIYVDDARLPGRQREVF